MVRIAPARRAARRLPAGGGGDHRGRSAREAAPSAGDVLLLAVALVRRGAALGTQSAQRSGLHANDVRALQALDAAGGEGGTTTGALPSALGLSPQAVTALVGRLEGRDLARREPDPADRRRTRVVPTQTARSSGRAHLAPLAAHLRAAGGGLTAAERSVVHRLLQASGTLGPGPRVAGLLADASRSSARPSRAQIDAFRVSTPPRPGLLRSRRGPCVQEPSPLRPTRAGRRVTRPGGSAAPRPRRRPRRAARGARPGPAPART